MKCILIYIVLLVLVLVFNHGSHMDDDIDDKNSDNKQKNDKSRFFFASL